LAAALFLAALVAQSALAGRAEGIGAYQAGDHAAAFALFRAAAKQGHAGTQYNMGFLHKEGRAVAREEMLALMWFTLAADKSDALAVTHCNDLAERLTGGQVAAAQQLARFRTAAEAGNETAEFNLGVMYLTGRRIEQDAEEALRWFKRAAARGHTGAKFNFSFMYTEGRTVDQDDVEAQKWFILAAAGDDARARQAQTFLAQRMTQEQMTDAQARARAWLDEFGGR
jgi:TPR repeat protein